MSTEPQGCQFECQIRTDFGQATDSALMIENWRDGLKVKGEEEKKKSHGAYRHRMDAGKQRCASVPTYAHTSRQTRTKRNKIKKCKRCNSIF